MNKDINCVGGLSMLGMGVLINGSLNNLNKIQASYYNVSSTNYSVQYQRFLSSFAPQEYPDQSGIPFGLSSVSLPPVAVPSGCPRMSFCERILTQPPYVGLRPL